MAMNRPGSRARSSMLPGQSRQGNSERSGVKKRSFKQGILNAETEQPETNGKQWVLDALGPAFPSLMVVVINCLPYEDRGEMARERKKVAKQRVAVKSSN